MMKKLLLVSAVGVLLNPMLPCFAGDVDVVETVNHDFPVYVPDLPSSNSITGGAIFLQPGGSNDYGVVVSPFNPYITEPVLSPSWQVEGIKPNFDAGFYVNFRHVFADSGNDISVNWAHSRSNKSFSPSIDNNNPPYFQMSGPNWEIGPDADGLRQMRGSVKFHYDIVNAEVAKHVNFDPNLKTRIILGVSGVFLKQETQTDFNEFSTPYVANVNLENSSRYNAAGLRFGFDNEYRTFGNVEVVGLFAGTLFIGNMHPSFNSYGVSNFLAGNGIPEVAQSITHDNYTEIVPAIDGKLGLKYAFAWSPEATLTFEAGYMGAIYVNAIQNYVPSTYVPNSQGLNSGAFFLQSLIKTTEDYTVAGPYITATFTM